MCLPFHLDFVTDETMILSYRRSDRALQQAGGRLPDRGYASLLQPGPSTGPPQLSPRQEAESTAHFLMGKLTHQPFSG